MKKIVILGGVAGGATAAAKARRELESAKITIFERGPFLSFANCGLPYYIGGEISDRSKLLLQNPESFWKRYKILARVNHEVLEIDRPNKSIKVFDRVNKTTFQEPYDKLILCPGAGAIVPPLKGIDSDNIFVVKTVPDTDKIKSFLQERKPKNAVVVGAGFIGLETAEALLHQKLEVTIVELVPQVLPPFDHDMAEIVQHHLQHSGINLMLNDGVKGFIKEKESATFVELNSGKKIPCDLVILSIGVRPEIKLAKESGITIGVTGGIQVNSYQQTSDPDIYAAGDAVEVQNILTEKPTRFALAGPANKQGRVAGANAAIGNQIQFKGAIGTCILECLGITAGMTGLTERACLSEKIPYIASIVHPLNHAGYYPGAHTLHIKMISHKENKRILGVQIVGEAGVDKRVDVVATAISGKMTTEDMENIDLAYSPQFGSAHDPIIQAAFSSMDQHRGTVSTITYSEFEKERDKYFLVDVRTPSEFKEGHIEGAVNIPVDDLRERFGEIKTDKSIVTICRVGMRGYIAARILKQNGFLNVKNLVGGMLTVNAEP